MCVEWGPSVVMNYLIFFTKTLKLNGELLNSSSAFDIRTSRGIIILRHKMKTVKVFVFSMSYSYAVLFGKCSKCNRSDIK